MRKLNKKIKIGDKFTPKQRGKKVDKSIYTIKDIYITRNSKNEIIDIKYYCETPCLQQILTWLVSEATVLMGKKIINSCIE